MKGVIVKNPTPQMIIGVMVRAQLDALKINQLEGGFVGYGEQHA